MTSFFEQGTDIIRLNLSHLKLDISKEELERDPTKKKPADDENLDFVFREVKAAILKCEQACNLRRRLCILADLPGPKIRGLTTGDVPLELPVGEPIDVHLGPIELEGRAIQVRVDSRPLAEVLTEKSPTATAEFWNGIRQPNARLDLGDGQLTLVPKDINQEANRITCTLEAGSTQTLGRNKAVTFKGIPLDIESFTEHDAKLLDRLLELDYEPGQPWNPVIAFVALSFVQSHEDVLRARYAVEKKLPDCFKTCPPDPHPHSARLFSPVLVAKIETETGYLNRQAILDIADGLMVARGDLGTQTALELVPGYQKTLIKLCNKRGRAVITATQMLASMVDKPQPTRAEVSDVFNAIEDGTDAVMMSEETATGMYPREAIGHMRIVAKEAEKWGAFEGLSDAERRLRLDQRRANLLADDAERLAEQLTRLQQGADAAQAALTAGGLNPPIMDFEQWKLVFYKTKHERLEKQELTNRETEMAANLAAAEDIVAVIVPTRSGRTARMIARFHPEKPIIGAAHDVFNARKLLATRGVLPIVIAPPDQNLGLGGLLGDCSTTVRHLYAGQFGLKSKARVVYVAGLPIGGPVDSIWVTILSLPW